MTDRPQAACGGSTDEQGPHYAVRRARIARDVLRDWDGALAVERDRHRMGARSVALPAILSAIIVAILPSPLICPFASPLMPPSRRRLVIPLLPVSGRHAI